MFSLNSLALQVEGVIIGDRVDFKNLSIVTDSRKVTKDSVFIAIEGPTSDGHNFLEDVLVKSPICVIINTSQSNLIQGKSPFITVQDTRKALAILAAQQYKNPAKKIKLIGVTGTNGKTSTVWIIHELLKLLGKKSFRIGTLGVDGLKNSAEYSNLTTPGPHELNKLLAEALTQDIEYCVLEVSSHALDQDRVFNLPFYWVGLTNITRDHLDYHKTFENYIAAKEKIFEFSNQGGICIDNISCEEIYNRQIKNNKNITSLGFNKKADIQLIKRLDKELLLIFEIIKTNNHYKSKTNYVGAHNLENIGLAVSCLESLEIAPIEKIMALLKTIPPVPGRLEPVGSAEFPVFVDYAHTPDALEKVLQTLKPLTKNKLWVIFGCGGNRDKGKRPLMAEAAAKYADFVVVTSDNPRKEDPELIIQDILASGINAKYVNVDRKIAIEETLKMALSGDTVLIAGKGHEDYQIIGEEKFYFSDQAVVKALFNKTSIY